MCLLYNPINSTRFHSTACVVIQRAQQIGTIKNYRQVPEDTKIFRMYGHFDVRPENIKVLCKSCHSKQPYHDHKNID